MNKLTALNNIKTVDNKVLVTEEIAEKIKEAQKSLPKEYELLIVEGCRSSERQKRLYKDYCRKLKKENPNWDEEKLSEEVEKFIANPKDNPPHVFGRAIDIILLKGGRKVDMGTEYDDFNKKSYTNSKKISIVAQKNRKILVKAMTKAGFGNCPEEWWHWEL